MANWAEKRDFGSDFGLGPDRACTDGVHVYFVGANEDIHRYTPATDTLTLIASAATFNPGNLGNSRECGPVFFNSAIYVGVDRFDTGQAQVWRYDGSWSTDFTIPNTGNSALITLKSDATAMVCAATESHYTTGSGWLAATADAGIVSFGLTARATGNDQRLGIHSNTQENQIIKFSSGNWSIADTVAGNEWLHRMSVDRGWLRRSDDTYDWTTDFASYTKPTNTTVIPALAADMPYPVGYKILNPAQDIVEIYFWDTTANQWLATADGVINVQSSGLVNHVLRLTSGKTYLLARGEDSSKIYERDGVILPVTQAKLYAGQNGTLAEKSTLTVPGVLRGGLLVRDAGPVVVASNQDSAVMVAQATSADDYATWSDLTGSHPQSNVGAIEEL